eukprot:5516724-Prymnesium_polylepis.1
MPLILERRGHPGTFLGAARSRAGMGASADPRARQNKSRERLARVLSHALLAEMRQHHPQGVHGVRWPHGPRLSLWHSCSLCPHPVPLLPAAQ